MAGWFVFAFCGGYAGFHFLSLFCYVNLLFVHGYWVVFFFFLATLCMYSRDEVGRDFQGAVSTHPDFYP